MQIKSVYIKNFKGIGNNGYTFNFDNKFNLIKGRPGTGKTTILSAISFCLFNKNTDYKGNTSSTLQASKLINDINKKDMLVEVTLDNGYKIVRGLSPAIFQVLNEKGIDVNELSSKKLDQEELENNILKGLTFDIFMTTNYLCNKPTSIPFLYMSKTQRKDYIEKLLDLRIVYFMNENLKPFISENSLEKNRIQSEINITNNTIENETQNVKSMLIKLEEQKKRLANYEEDKSNRIEEQKKRLANYEEDKSNIEIQLETANKELEVLKNFTSKYNNDLVVEYNSNIKDNESTINKLKNAFKEKQMQLNAFEENKKNYGMCGNCPTLEKIIGSFDYSSFDGLEEKINSKILEIQNKITNLQDSINEQISFKAEFDENNSKIFEKEQHIKTLNQNLNMLKHNINNCLDIIDNINKEVKPELFEVNVSYLKELKQKLATLETEKDENYNQKIQLDELKQLINDKEHKANALKTYLPIFEKKLNELLDRFLVNMEFSVKAKLEEDFELSFTKNNKELDIFSLSNGQKVLISLATTFSFLYILEVKHQNSFNHLFVDEVLDNGLNSEVLQVLDYLKELSYNKNITVISHNNFLLDYPEFDKIIESTKDNGFSKYIDK